MVPAHTHCGLSCCALVIVADTGRVETKRWLNCGNGIPETLLSRLFARDGGVSAIQKTATNSSDDGSDIRHCGWSGPYLPTATELTWYASYHLVALRLTYERHSASAIRTCWLHRSLKAPLLVRLDRRGTLRRRPTGEATRTARPLVPRCLPARHTKPTIQEAMESRKGSSGHVSRTASETSSPAP